MAATPKELREKRAKLVPRMQELRDKHHSQEGWSEEDRGNWTKINAEYDALSEQIRVAEQTEEVDRRIAEVESEQRQAAGDRRVGRDDVDGRSHAGGGPITDEQRALAFQGWCRAQMDEEPSQEQREAAQLVGLRLNQKKLGINLLPTQGFRQLQQAGRRLHSSRMELLNERALSGFAGASGGYTTLPATLVRNLEVAMLTYGGLRQFAEVIRTATGEEMGWPTANDTGNKGRRIGENKAVAEGNPPVFGKTTWYAYGYTSDAILVPYYLLEDSAFDLASVLGSMLGERLGRKTNEDNTLGTGAAMPNGIVPAATLGVTAASATAISTDEIIRLEHSVDPAYRNGAAYMMHDNVILALRLLKDGEGRYLWQSGVRDGKPDTLNGYQVGINMDMASSVAASAKTILFGQFSKFKIREVGSVRLYRLEERYRENDQDGFMAFLRQDAGLLDAGTHPVKYLQQAA